jgi:hypothetical protein
VRSHVIEKTFTAVWKDSIELIDKSYELLQYVPRVTHWMAQKDGEQIKALVFFEVLNK